MTPAVYSAVSRPSARSKDPESIKRGERMQRVWFAALSFFVTGLPLCPAEELKPAYDFSMPREARIQLAESAAPQEVSSKATVYLLEPTGYVKVREGTNGFSCIVDRQSPLNLEPTCFDAEGTTTTLPTRLYVEEQRAKGKSEEQITSEVEERYKNGTFHPPRKPGIVYMMSEQGYLFHAPLHKLVPIPPHLMFYAPYATEKDLGSPPHGINMPKVIREGQPDAYIVVLPRKADHTPP